MISRAGSPDFDLRPRPPAARPGVPGCDGCATQASTWTASIRRANRSMTSRFARRRWSRSTCRCTRRHAWRLRCSSACGPSIRTARLAAYGLYAPLNRTWLRARRARCAWDPRRRGTGEARRTPNCPTPNSRINALNLIQSIQPDRTTLPPLTRYAALQMPDGTRRVVGSTDTTRGCKHLCRHCPIVPVYQGRFKAIPIDVVLAGHSRAGGRRRRAHHVWRSRFLQRADACASRGRASRARSSRGSPTT